MHYCNIFVRVSEQVTAYTLLYCYTAQESVLDIYLHKCKGGMRWWGGGGGNEHI